MARPVIALAGPLVLLGLGLGVVSFDSYGLASRVRGALFDAYQAHSVRREAIPATPRFRIVEIDPVAIDRIGHWPWNQTRLAALTRAITDQGARMVVFADVLPSTDTDPKNLAALLSASPTNDAARAALAAAPSPEATLASAFETAPTILAARLGERGTAPPPPRAHMEYRGRKSPFAAAPLFSTASAPPPALVAAAAGLGAVNIPADADGVVRRMPGLFGLGAGVMPSLAVEAARVLSGAVKMDFDGDDGLLGARLNGFEIAGREIATETDGRFWIDYGGKALEPPLTASALMAGVANPLALKDAIVIVGAPDRLATPLGAQSRPVILARSISNLVTGTVLIRPVWAPFAEFAFLLATGAVTMLLLAQRRIHWAGLFSAISIVLIFYGSWFGFAARHWLVDAAMPSLALGLCFAGGALWRLGELHQARIGVRLAFADSLPRASIEKIARKPALLTSDGEIRNVTYLVCGVRGLAGLAARFQDDPKGFTQLLQQVLSPLLDQALAHGGTIDRLTADGFAAFWNAPLEDNDHALHACEAANGMSIMAARVSESLTINMQDRPMPLEVGVGIATGNVIAGGFGGHGRLGYSVNGEAPVLAARLQAMSGQYGPAVIVADETHRAAARGFAFLEVDMIAAGPDDAPVRLYAMLGNPVVRSSPKFRALITFHEHIFQSLRAQQWAKARALIEQCRKLSGASQRLYDLHLARIRYFETHPPGSEWDGAFRQVVK